MWLALAATAQAHEVKSALLDIREMQPASYVVVWRVPVIEGEALGVRPVLPEDCEVNSRTRSDEGLSITETVDAICDSTLADRFVAFRGLERSDTDVLVSYRPLDGAGQTLRATPDQPSLSLPAEPSALRTAWTYAKLGFIHIFEGPDHLAFVLGLLLLIRGKLRLVKAITAFTVAHSITLAAAVLGFAGLPGGPVEAVIALSIVFLALEVVRNDPDSLSRRAPWVAAFAFGLLHGFGFAGALGDIGLPEGEVPLALLSFNLGIEAGQLTFVAIVGTLVLWPLSRLDWRHIADRVAAYGLGGIATAWTLTRLAGM